MNARQRLARLEARGAFRAERPTTPEEMARLLATIGLTAAYHLVGWRPGDDVVKAFVKVATEYGDRDLLDVMAPTFDGGAADRRALFVALWGELPREAFDARDELAKAIRVEMRGSHWQ